MLILLFLLLLVPSAWAEDLMTSSYDSTTFNPHARTIFNCNSMDCSIDQETMGRTIVARTRRWNTEANGDLCIIRHPSRSYWVNCITGIRDEFISPSPDPCLARMEQAMRAMEAFLLIHVPHTYQVPMNKETVDTSYEYAYHFTLPSENVSLYRPEAVWQTMNAKAGTAIVSWNSAKACWRKP